MMLLAEFWPYIAGFGAMIAAGVSVYFKGRSDANTKHKIKEMERNHETRKRMDDIDVGGDDLEFLRDRARK